MGPYTVDQINEYLAQGSLLPTDYAWHEGLPDWVPVTQITGVGHAVTHVEYVNGKPKTVRAMTGKLLLFWIIFLSFFSALGLGLLVFLRVISSGEFIGIWLAVSIGYFIGCLGLRRPSNCNRGFAADKKHYTLFGMQIWKE